MKYDYLVVVIILGISAIFIFGCEQTKYRFDVGQRVEHVLDGREGIVLERYPTIDQGTRQGTKYKVRFVCGQQTTDTGIISSDGPIQNAPYAEVRCSEYELRPKGE